MNVNESLMIENGLALVNKIYEDRGNRAKELKAEGRKIFGYFCSQTPIEYLTAANIVPYRITGNVRQAMSEVEGYLEPIACPFTRSCLNMAVQGEYDFLDGFIVPHACDNIVKIYDIWKYNINHSYTHFINVPHTMSKPAHKFFEAELGTFKRSMEKFTGEVISFDSLSESIELHNQNRDLVRKLYELRKENPPLISGSEIVKTLVAVVSLPVSESNRLLESVIKDVKGRKEGPQEQQVRILIYGSQVDDNEFIDIIEDCGANVVMDDVCIGSRPFWHDIVNTGAPLKNIADHYLEKIRCPRVFQGGEGTYAEDLEERFGYLRDFAKDFDVNGIILHVITYCDIYAFDLPDVREFFTREGLPVLELDDEYAMRSIAGLTTRVQAFVEMIAQNMLTM